MRPSSPAGSGRSGSLRAGIRIGLGLSTATFALAVPFGATAVRAGWSVPGAVLCSLLVFSSSAQFALLTALPTGGLVPAVASAALINARFIPMATAVAPDLRGGPLRRALFGQAVVDGSWAAARVGSGRFDPDRMVGATLPQWPAWVAGTVLGALLAPPEGIVQSLALDVIFPGFFLLLLVDEVRSSRSARMTALLAAAISAGLVTVVPAGLALISSTTAALLGLRHANRKPAE